MQTEAFHDPILHTLDPSRARCGLLGCIEVEQVAALATGRQPLGRSKLPITPASMTQAHLTRVFKHAVACRRTDEAYVSLHIMGSEDYAEPTEE